MKWLKKKTSKRNNNEDDDEEEVDEDSKEPTTASSSSLFGNLVEKGSKKAMVNLSSLSNQVSSTTNSMLHRKDNDDDDSKKDSPMKQKKKKKSYNKIPMNQTQDQTSTHGHHLQIQNFRPHHPIALFNSLSGCQLEVTESSTRPDWISGALWVEMGHLSSASLKNVVANTSGRKRRVKDSDWKGRLMLMMDEDGDGDVDVDELLEFLEESEDLKEEELVQDVLKEYYSADEEEGGKKTEGVTTEQILKQLEPIQPKLMSSLLTKRSTHESMYMQTHQTAAESEWAKHMQLVDGWKDPEGIKVRPRKGVKAMECLVANDQNGITNSLGAGLMIGVTKHLRKVGYEAGKDLRGFGYDWRMPCTKMEERDGYFSKVMDDMEDLKSSNEGRKIVVITHSLGGVCAHYFFHWVAHSPQGQERGGKEWIEDHIHSFLPIAAPFLGSPHGGLTFLRGDEEQGMAPAVVSYADRHVLIRSWLMFGMIFPTGANMMLQPTQSVFWLRREGVLRVHVLKVQIPDGSVSEIDGDAEKDHDGNDGMRASHTSSISSRRRKYRYVEISFRGPNKDDTDDVRTHKLNTVSRTMVDQGAYDEQFQFVWFKHPETINGANLTFALRQMNHSVGVFPGTLDDANFELASRSSSDDDDDDDNAIDDSLPPYQNLIPNQWSEHTLRLRKGVKITVRLKHDPYQMNHLPNDFRPPSEHHHQPIEDTDSATENLTGAWRCGGTADRCTTTTKKKRLLSTLGPELGTEWHPVAIGSPNDKLQQKNTTMDTVINMMNTLTPNTASSSSTQTQHRHATYDAMSMDEMMVVDGMKHEYNCWKQSYNDDTIWNQHSTECPPGIHRIRPIYGIQVPTVIGSVFRRQTKRHEREEASTGLKLDKHCVVSHPGYDTKKKDGKVMEVPYETPQADDAMLGVEQQTFHKRASGDGTVTYWSLRWPITWRDDQEQVDVLGPIEVEGAGHRDILDTRECAEMVLAECCSHPIRYVEIWLESLILGKSRQCTSDFNFAAKFTAAVVTLGAINDRVFVELDYKGDVFSSETVHKISCCLPAINDDHHDEDHDNNNKKHTFKDRRFAFGLSQEDIDNPDLSIKITVKSPYQAHIPSGSILDGTNTIDLPLGDIVSLNDEIKTLSFDEKEEVTLSFCVKSYEPDEDGLPWKEC